MMKINERVIKEGDRIVINGEDYEVISLETDNWYVEGKGIVELGETATLHKTGDETIGLPHAKYVLFFDNKTKKFSFSEKKFENNASKDHAIPIREVIVK